MNATNEPTPDFVWEARHAFYIDGFRCPADHVTQALSLQPTHTWRAGDPTHIRDRRPAPRSGWALDTPDRAYTTDQINALDHLADLRRLVDHLWNRRDQLTALLAEGAEVHLVTSISSDSPNICCQLPTELITRLLDLRASHTFSCWFMG